MIIFWRGRSAFVFDGDVAIRINIARVPTTVSPNGIATAEAFGTATLTDGGTISPSSIRAPFIIVGTEFLEAFGTAIIQGAIVPNGIASTEAIGSHNVGDVNPSAIASAEAFGAVLLLAGDIGPNGIASEESVPFPELTSSVGAAGTISPTAIASAGAFGDAVLTEDARILPVGIASAFDMDLHNVGAGVATIAPFGIASEEAFSIPVATPPGGLSGAGGGANIFQLSNPTPPLAGSVTAKKLCAPFTLLRAEIYNTAPEPAAILPEVYGDLRVSGIRGPCPAVLVTQTSPWIYIAAAHPVFSIDNVFIGDVMQTGGFATLPAVSLGGGPQVAAIAFSNQPTDQVTWQGQGRMDDMGVLISNPIEQLERLLLDRGAFAPSDFDSGPLAEAKNVLDVRYPRWTTQWVINDERQIQDWINEWMFNVMGYWRVTGAGQLQLAVEPGLPQVHFTSADVVESIVASRDCVDGDDGVVFTMDRHHLVNKLEAFYLWSWGEGKAVNRLIGPTAEDAISINAYGEIRKAVTLRGNRYQPYVEEWANILFSRQAFDSRVEGATVEFTVKGSKLAHATISDLLAFSWPYGPTRENGNIYVNQIIRIVSITHDYARGGSSRVTALDTGDYVTLGGVRLLNPLEL